MASSAWGAAALMARRTLRSVERAGSGTRARYASTSWAGPPFLMSGTGRRSAAARFLVATPRRRTAARAALPATDSLRAGLPPLVRLLESREVELRHPQHRLHDPVRSGGVAA